MENQFKTRKVFEAMTVGECLKKERERLDIFIEDASEKLKIKKSYLENLENDEYGKLPPPVYVKGFIKDYANLLGLDCKKLVDLYNREIIIDNRIKKEIKDTGKEQGKKINPVTLNRFIPSITFKSITVFLGLAILSLIGYYLWHQASSFSSTPYLLITSPSTDKIVDVPEIVIEGKTEINTIVRINNEDTFVDQNGNFKEDISLKPGKNVFIVEATNRFNKTAKEELNIIYEKKPEPPVVNFEEDINAEIPLETNSAESGQVNGSESYIDDGMKIEVIGP